MMSSTAWFATLAIVLSGTSMTSAQCYDYRDAPAILYAVASPQIDMTSSVALHGHHVYLSATTNAHLRTYDISDPANPILTSTLTEPGATDLVVAGDRLVAGSVASLVLFDLADPAQPVLLGSTVSPGGLRIQDIAVDGDRALTVSRNYLDWSYVVLWDISGDQPVALGSTTTSVATDCVEIVGDWGYVGTFDDNRVWPVDLHDPSDPILASPAAVIPGLSAVTSLDRTSQCLVAIGEATSGGYLVASIVHQPPSSPVIADSWSSSANFRTASRDGEVMTIVEGYGQADRYRWLDCADPYALVAGGGALFASRSPKGVVRGDDICFVATFTSGLQVLRTGWDDLPVSRTPGVYARYGEAAAVGDHVYICDADTLSSRLYNFDARNLTFGAPLPLNGRALHLADGPTNLVAAATSGDLVIIDAASPAQPVVRGSVAVVGIRRMVWDGPQTIYLTSQQGPVAAVQRIDVADPQAPDIAGILAGYPVAGPLAAGAGWVYVASGIQPGNIDIVDFRDPAAPVVVGQLDVDGVISDLAVDHGRLYVSDPYLRFLVYDLADPAQPQHLAALAIPDPNPYGEGAKIRGLVLDGQVAYVWGNEGAGAIDLADAAQPAYLGWLPCSAYSLDGAEDLVLAADRLVLPVDYYFGSYLAFLPLECSTTEVAGLLPPAGCLLASPNPFNPRVTFSFTLAAAQAAELAAYDLAGRRVAVLAADVLPAGVHAIGWTGVDDGGRALPSGVYLARLHAGERREITRVTLVR